jgi:processive 1,2-diacylglycerol beta-glucosyltransferase
MKVLVVYAKAGAGHKRAAEAVFAAFKHKGQAKDVILVDCLDYMNSWFKNFYPRVYLFLVRFLSFVWGGIYYGLDNRLCYSLIQPLRRLNNHLVAKRFITFLKKERPQVVISTHFFASEVVAALKNKKEFKTVLISVITDFGAHTFWESRGVDTFVVASEDTKQDLLSRNIPAEKIKILGIPIEPPSKDFDRAKLLQEIGLKQELFTILLVGGGFGVGPIKELVYSLDELKGEIRDRVQLIVVCSRNQKLYKEMKHIGSRFKINLKIFGFVNELYKMMAASDMIISKSGGLTTSEALACGLPMIIISPIPGQETKNCKLLVRNGAALRIDRPVEVKKIVEELVRFPHRLEKMRQQALCLGRSHSADDIVTLANSYLENI